MLLCACMQASADCSTAAVAVVIAAGQCTSPEDVRIHVLRRRAWIIDRASPTLIAAADLLTLTWQVCAWDGGDCCAATCKPVSYATYYGLTAAQIANISGTANLTASDVTSQLPFSCRCAPRALATLSLSAFVFLCDSRKRWLPKLSRVPSIFTKLPGGPLLPGMPD